MKRIFAFAVAAGALAGCVSHPEAPVVAPYSPETAPLASPVTDRPYVEGATIRPLRVIVSVDGGEDTSSAAYQLSGYLQSGLEGELAKRGYRVVYDRPAEMLVSTTAPVMCRPLNARGSRVVFEGDADFQVTREAFVNKMKDYQMKDVVARRRFDLKGAQSRNRPGNTDAIKSVADRNMHELSEWMAASLTRVAGALERCEFTVCNGWSYRGEEEYPSRFVRTIQSIDGVYDCRIVSTDNVSRSIRVEVIYEKDMFPEGFINALYTVRELDLYR